MARAMFINGKWVKSKATRDIINPYSGDTVDTVCEATAKHLGAAADAAVAGFATMRQLRSYERASLCAKIANLIMKRADEFADTIASEAGKPLKYARGEAQRAVATFTVAAEEAKRIGGEFFPLDWTAAAGDRSAVTSRFPVGPVFAITPFNFPLNLVAHKVAPALASGCSIVVKPASKTPLSSLLLAEVAAEAGVPEGALNVVPCPRDVADALVPDERFAVLTFTGSSKVGWDLKARAGRKRVLLELGGNAGCIIDESADLDRAAARCAMGAFANQGQVCISVQRIYVHENVKNKFMNKFLDRVSAIKTGDPLDAETDLSAMIDEANAERVESWVMEAVEGGAKILTGGKRDGLVYAPTVLTDVKPEMKISCDEVFGPVVAVTGFTDFAAAVDAVNDSPYGLQAGVFTNNLSHAQAAFEELEVGGVIINDVPTFRVDHMPYGGVKGSGFGREGLRYAIEELTELRLCVITRDV